MSKKDKKKNVKTLSGFELYAAKKKKKMKNKPASSEFMSLLYIRIQIGKHLSQQANYYYYYCGKKNRQRKRKIKNNRNQLTPHTIQHITQLHTFFISNIFDEGTQQKKSRKSVLNKKKERKIKLKTNNWGRND